MNDPRYAALVAKVEALADEWRYKGEFGWGAWQEGQGPDQEGWVLDGAAGQLRTLLDTDASEALERARREAKAEALREAADEMITEAVGNRAHWRAAGWRSWLRARADRIARGEGE